MRIEGLFACSRLLVAALAGWAVLAVTELVVLGWVLRLLAMVVGPELVPSLKVVLDTGLMAACGWVAGRLGRPYPMAAAVLSGAGLALFDLTPYLPLDVRWLLHLSVNAAGDSRYLLSWVSTLTMHALMFGALLLGAYLSRRREAQTELRLQR